MCLGYVSRGVLLKFKEEEDRKNPEAVMVMVILIQRNWGIIP